MKKFLMTAVAAGVAVFSSAAVQAQVLPVNVYTPGGGTAIVQNITDFDYNSNGSAVVIGAGPFIQGFAVPNGTLFTNKIQTNVIGFNRGASAVGSSEILAGLNDNFGAGGYEITAVATFVEQVVSSTVNSTTFQILSGTVAIYFDNTASGGVKADLAAGTGYDDGALIWSGSIIGGDANFTAATPTVGLGSTNVIASTSFIDATSLQNLPSSILSIFLNAEGQTGYPAGNATTANYHIGGSAAYPNYVVDTVCEAGPGSCDLQLRFDGSSRFVPEPGALALLGVAAVAAGAGVRRNRKSK